jgi:hypothetical protein
MTQTGRRARVAHAIPGRLRIRFEGGRLDADRLDAERPDARRFDVDAPDPTSDGLAVVRLAPGVLAVETKPASNSAIIRYDPAETSEAAILMALEQAGLDLVADAPSAAESRTSPSDPRSSMTSGSTAGASPTGQASGADAGAVRDPRGRFRRRDASAASGQGEDRQANAGQEAPEQPSDGSSADQAGARSTLMEMLIGPPPKFDRRFAESLALSAVSLLAARRVGLALGGGTTLPAYFAIWLALRRMTGLGRRR